MKDRNIKNHILERNKIKLKSWNLTYYHPQLMIEEKFMNVRERRSHTMEPKHVCEIGFEIQNPKKNKQTLSRSINSPLSLELNQGSFFHSFSPLYLNPKWIRLCLPQWSITKSPSVQKDHDLTWSLSETNPEIDLCHGVYILDDY